jgi:hypothetical protein
MATELLPKPNLNRTSADRVTELKTYDRTSKPRNVAKRCGYEILIRNAETHAQYGIGGNVAVFRINWGRVNITLRQCVLDHCLCVT